MSNRALALFVFAFLELLAGIILRNEALAARGRAEAQVRRELTCERRERETRSLMAVLTSPAALEQRARQKAGRVPAAGNRPPNL
jgi:hypothetical protein